jgi:hypothetical protein
MASSDAPSSSSSPPTVYEALHHYLSLGSDPSTTLTSTKNGPKASNLHHHPYGASASIADELRALLHTTDSVSASLNAHLAQPWTDEKLTSALRQRVGIQHNHLSTQHAVQQTLATLRAHVESPGRASGYGEDVPAAKEEVSDWCISRLEKWGKEAGMETFREEESEGRVPVLLGGQVLVLDVDFQISRNSDGLDGSSSRISVLAVKTSYASDDGARTMASSAASLAGFIHDRLAEFLDVAQVSEDERDVVKVAALAKDMQQHLVYLMRLDKLAKAEGNSGVRWFTALDELASTLEAQAAAAARTMAQSIIQFSCLTFC